MMASADPNARLGTLLGGRYRIDSLLGAGAMGAVYLARHEVLLREFAVKVLRRDLADDPRIARRFQREARAASRVQHPNIVYISDFGTTEDGSLFLVMEYIPGHDLRQELRQCTTLEPPRALHLLVQLADALDCAHRAGVVHRDLKPENLILTEHRGKRDHLKVLDFGMAKILEPSAPPGLQITGRGEVQGTPEYMSPEQVEGREVGPASDIYTLGVVAYELLTGVPPYSGVRMEVLLSHCNTPPVPPSCRRPQAGLLPAFDAIVGKCLSKRPEDRYATAGAAKVALQRLLHFVSGEASTLAGREDTDYPARAREPAPPSPPGEGGTDTHDGNQKGTDPVQAPELFQRTVRELAEGLRDHGLGSAELTLALTAALEAEEHVFAEEAEVALGEAQIAEADHTTNEREARLRYAVMQLSQERARMVVGPDKLALARTLRPDGEEATPAVDLQDTSVSQIDAHIAELERRMYQLDQDRRARVEEIDGRLGAHRRAAEAWSRQLDAATLRLYELVQRVRGEVRQLELLRLYHRLDDLRPPQVG
ncbi:MAG: protein kinase [Deltaproteobacteria bacterium]|nr:protein kinase [Deltaproteobacteria bacterium]